MRNIINKIFFLFLICFVFFSASLFGQTAARLELLLSEQELTWSQAAGFLLEASEKMTGSPEQAFAFVMEQKWLPVHFQPNDKARLQGIALLLMRSFELKGGIFYSITHSQHHAFRELVYKEVISGDKDPRAYVSGRDLLLMVNKILSEVESLQAEK